MARIFALDVLECPRCGGRMRILAAIEDPSVARKILDLISRKIKNPFSRYALARLGYSYDKAGTHAQDSIKATELYSRNNLRQGRMGGGRVNSLQQIDFGFTSSIARQFDFDAMLAGAQKHGMKGSTKIAGVPDVTIIHKHGRAGGLYVQFQFGSFRAGVGDHRSPAKYKGQSLFMRVAGKTKD